MALIPPHEDDGIERGSAVAMMVATVDGRVRQD
jgi:hypothetical protein